MMFRGRVGVGDSLSEPTNFKHCQNTYRHLPTGRSRYDPYSSVSTKWYYRENRKFSEQQLSIFKCWFKELEELNSTDNFKVKFVQNNFLSILITNYILNSFNLEDWKMLKINIARPTYRRASANTIFLCSAPHVRQTINICCH